MPRPKLVLARLTAALALAGMLAACGGDDSSGEGAANDSTTTAAADGTCTGGSTVTVDVGDFVFDPTPVEIERCDSVVWTNAHNQAHTSTGQGEQRWNTGNIQPGDDSEPVVFERSGTFSYICALHPFMKGSVEVST